jgi:mono/diheme cytochrome c family protein
MRQSAIIAIGLIMVAGGAAAQTLGDPAAGQRLAAVWCSECHAIGQQAADALRRGPGFVEVANRPKTTPLSLNVFLRSNHDSMPNFILKRDEADDIVAYILTLKRD